MTAPTPVPLIPRQTFFENAHALNPKISPDGNWLSWVAAVDGVMNVWVAPRADLSKARPLTRQTDRPIFQHDFARTNAHILFSRDTGGDENFHVWCVGLDGADARDLTPFTKTLAHIVGLHHGDPQLAAIAMNDRDPSWHDLYIVDIRTGVRTLLYQNTNEISDFGLDTHLRLTMATSSKGKGAGKAILKWTGSGFEEIYAIEPDDALTTQPLLMNRAGTAWYLRSSMGRDKAAIFRVDRETGAETLIGAHDKADVGGVLVDPRTDEVTAYAVDYLRGENIGIEPAVRRDLARLERELDGSISIVSQSDDDGLWIAAVSRPDRPVRWHILDRATGALTPLFSARPKLEGLPLADMHPVVITSRDGLDLVCYLTLPTGETRARPRKPLPMVLEVHGGPWGRDGWHYNRAVQWLANRGYGVLQVNYRGSTGFGKAFINAGDREWAGKMHDDLIDAVDWAITEGIADPSRVAIMGGSYGGFASFVGATFTPEKFCCSVPVVGITNLETFQASIPPYWASFVEQLARRVGDPRTEEGRALLRSRSPLHRAGDIARPMLIGHGANDPRCAITESDAIVAAMTAKGIPVTYVVFPDEGHGFARPENDIAFNAITEAFLARHLRGRCEPVGGDFKGSSHQIRAGGDILAAMVATPS